MGNARKMDGNRKKPWRLGWAVLVEQGKMAKHLTHFEKKKIAERLP